MADPEAGMILVSLNQYAEDEMAHHSSNEIPAWMREMFRTDRTSATPEPLGATGQFPEGKLTPEDEGEIRIGITDMDGKVVMDFGKATTWIGFTPDQAEGIADTLRARAEKARAFRIDQNDS